MNGGKRQDAALVNHIRLSVTQPSQRSGRSATIEAPNERGSQRAGEINSLGRICGPSSVRGTLAQATTNPTTVQKIALAAVRTNVWRIVDLNPDCSRS
jgi:hypothetical protein